MHLTYPLNILGRQINGDKGFSEILSGSIWSIGARVISTAMGFMVSVIIARFYGAEMVGVVAVINSFLMLAVNFTVAGTNTSILRLIPEHTVKYSASAAFRIYRKTLFLVITLSVLAAAGAFSASGIIAVKIFSKPHLQIYIAMAAVFIIFKSISMLNAGAVRALKLIRSFALMQLMPTLSNLIILLYFIAFTTLYYAPVMALLLSLAFSGLVGMVIMETAFKRRIRPDDKIESVSLSRIFSISWPMFLTTSMVFVIAETGVFMLGMFRTVAEVGYYAIAVKISTLTSFIIVAINTMAAPKFSELFHMNKITELFRVARKSAKLIFWATVPILCLLITMGKTILGSIYGQDYTVAYTAMVVLALGQFVNSVCGCTGIFMNMTGRQKMYRNFVMIAAILNILLNYVLIPKFGILGPAIASATSIAFWNLATLIYIKLEFNKTIGYCPLILNRISHRHIRRKT